MLRWIAIQEKVVPEMSKMLARRYRIMKFVSSSQPVGRRTLAQLTGLTERVLRQQTNFLKDQGLLTYTPVGMMLTDEGEHLLPDMDEWMRQWLGLTELEQQLQSRLRINKVMITPGDSSLVPLIKKDLGRIGVAQLKELAQPGSVVAVAGGTTMAAMAAAMTPHRVLKTLHYVPARGGLGEEVENQAGTICSRMAEQSGGNYRLLHLPDQLSEEAYQSVIDDPQIHEVLQKIRTAQIVVHGIGEAQTMAKRRQADESFLQSLQAEKAVAEAFGYYFDARGQIAHKMRTIGLQLEDIQQAQHVIAIAGGKDKAQAITAFLKHGIHDVLITDEGAAREMLLYSQNLDNI